MGKMKELFMMIREQEMLHEQEEMQNMHLDDAYHYEKYIQDKYKSPKHVCFMHAENGDLVMLQGNTVDEINVIAEKHKLQGEFQIMSPKQHLF